jgi:hypothetical protein
MGRNRLIAGSQKDSPFFGGLMCEHKAACSCVQSIIIPKKVDFILFILSSVLLFVASEVIIKFSAMAHFVNSHIFI